MRKSIAVRLRISTGEAAKVPWFAPLATPCTGCSRMLDSIRVALGSISKLVDLDAQTDALAPHQTQLGIAFFQKSLDPVLVLRKMHHPSILLIVKLHIKIYPALADIWIDFCYFFT